MDHNTIRRIAKLLDKIERQEIWVAQTRRRADDTIAGHRAEIERLDPNGEMH